MLLHKSLCSLQDGHHLRFVLEPLHILVAVSVAPLQDLDKLFVEALNGGEEAAAHLVGSLLKHLLLLEDGFACCHGVTFFLEHLQKIFDSLHALLPTVGLHSVRELGIVVKECCDHGELDLDVNTWTQVVLSGDPGQLIQQLDLLLPVGLFLAAGGHDLVHLLYHKRDFDLGISGKHSDLAHLGDLGPTLAFIPTGVTVLLLFLPLLFLLLLRKLSLLILRVLLLLLLGLLLRVFSLLQEHLSGVSHSVTKPCIAVAVRVAIGIAPIIAVRVRSIIHTCPGLLHLFLLLTLASRPIVVTVVIVILLLTLITALILLFRVELGDIVSHVLPHVLAQLLPETAK